jgi:hypothetical protein
MAKKRLTDMPSAKAVKQYLAQNKFDLAAEEARKLMGFAPSAATAELLREALFALASSCADRKQFADFNRLALELEPHCRAAGTESILALGRLLLRGMQISEVNRLIGELGDPEATALRGELADYFIRAKHSTSLLEEWKPAYGTFQKALQLYEAKKDDDARVALNDIGLGTPFLEWKIWLRGLLAWGEQDVGRALENWSRLNPKRLPYQLMAPLRAHADANWLLDQPALRDQLLQQYARLGHGGLGGQLRELRPQLAGRIGLAKSFKMAEAFLPRLKALHPTLVPRLANIFYHSMQRRGEPADLDRFFKVFGRMPDDPNFDKLSAISFEQAEESERALVLWQRHIDWLQKEAKWPALLKRQAIAVIYRTMANIVGRNDDLDKVDELDTYDDPFYLPAKKSKSKKPGGKVPLTPLDYLKHALEFAPDWEVAAAELLKDYLHADRLAEACTFAEQFLAANPNAMTVSRAYIDVLMTKFDHAGALVQLRRLRKANPFDAMIREMLTECTLHCMYLFVQDAAFEKALALFAEEPELLQGESPTKTTHLLYALHKKRKQTAEAEAEFQKIEPTRLLDAFLLMANAQLFKAKPAEKSAATKAYKASLADAPSVDDILLLYDAYTFFQLGGIDFTGLKTSQSGIATAMLNAGSDPKVTEDEGILLIAQVAALTTLPKFEKLAQALGKRFPKNPIFKLCIVETWLTKNPEKRVPYKIVQLLRQAKNLVRDSTDPKYKLLEERIDELNEQFDPFADMRRLFDGFL